MSRVALVTGGTRGIGAAISTTLKAAGRTVIANYASNDAAAIAFHSEHSIPVKKFDVCDFDACKVAIEEIVAAFGPIEIVVNNAGITREQQDEYAVRSHQRAAAAAKNGVFAAEIAGVPIPQRGGDALLVTEDEGIRPGTTLEALAKLRPAFLRDGTITAGTASQISDGAAAVVVTTAEFAERSGLNVIADIGAHGNVAGPDNSLHSQPSNAIKQALAKASLDVRDLDLVEINEAFSVVALQSVRELGVDPEIVNVNGGAIAIGHPIGASGARIALHLCYELGRRGGGLGAAALCGGGGQGESLLFRVRG